MTRVALVLGVLCVAPAAFAQAPGETPSQAPAAAAVPAAQDDVMANRWAVGLALGGMNVTTESQSGTGFGLIELALRFHATRHLELEAALGAGNSNDRMIAADQVRYALFDLRYRFSPAHAWNWWLEGGIGALAEFPKSAMLQYGAGQSMGDASRPLGELGIGLERRFHAFALDAELRAYAIGRPKVDPPPPGPITVVNGQVTVGPPATAAQLTIGASYYF